MRSLSAVLRWSVVLAPMVATAAWLSVTSAKPRQPTLLVETAPPVELDVPPRAVTHRPQKRTPPKRAPAPELTRAEVQSPPREPCHYPQRSIDLVPAKEVFSGPSGRKAVALTFDDGPSRENTPRVLRALRRAEVHATFFVLGDRAERMGDLLEAIDAGGHEIGNHGYSHTSMRSLFKSQIRDEVCRTQLLVEDATGKAPALLRPPFGRYPPSVVPLLGGLGYDLVLWSVDANDWKYDDPAQMADSVVRAAQPGSIILMHDREAVTAEALPLILAGLKQRGFDILTVSELTDLRPHQGSHG